MFCLQKPCNITSLVQDYLLRFICVVLCIAVVTFSVKGYCIELCVCVCRQVHVHVCSPKVDVRHLP